MQAALICPADRRAVTTLAHHGPLATAPMFGRSVLEFWIEALAAQGVNRITIFASDRPHRVRDLVGDGRRWGVRVDVVPTPHELSPDEAAARLEPAASGAKPAVHVLDHLPGAPDLPLLESYASWFAAQLAWMPRAASPARIGLRQLKPGVWAGMRCEIHPSARLISPCWIGDHVRIGAHATIGPEAMIDDRCVIETGACIMRSAVGPDTFVGKFVSVDRSLAQGGLLTHWQLNSSVAVPDPFLLGDLSAASQSPHRSSAPGRVAAGLMLLLTAPFAAGMVALSLLRGEPPWQLRLGLRSQRSVRRGSHETFAYYELSGAKNWLRRWPQFWNVLRGDMRWIGNRPLRPTEALGLRSDFERLWLTAPVGLIALADVYGCPDGISDESIAHASYYAAHASPRLNAFILSRAMLRAALVWPFLGRRKDTAVPLQQLVPKQEI